MAIKLPKSAFRLGLALLGLLSIHTQLSGKEVVLFDEKKPTQLNLVKNCRFENTLLIGKGRSTYQSIESYTNFEIRLKFRHTGQPKPKRPRVFINRTHVKLANAKHGEWQELHATFRKMPGEQSVLHQPALNDSKYTGDVKRFSEENIKALDEYESDAHGWVVGDAQPLVIVSDQDIEIARLSIRPLDPLSPREYLSQQGEALADFALQGKKIYSNNCVSCHGDGTGPALSPVMRSFALDPMQNGSDRMSLYNTLTHGYKLMAAARQLNDTQRHQVAAYLSEVLFKEHNPSQYKPITAKYIETLPFPLYTASEQFSRANKPEDQRLQENGRFRKHGPVLVDHYGEDYRNAINIILDDEYATSYDLYTMNQIDVRSGGFLNKLSSQHYKPRPSSITLPAGKPIQTIGNWKWLNHEQPRHQGHYINGNQAILSYQINKRDILEMPTVERKDKKTAFLQQLKIGPGSQALQIAIAPQTVDTPSNLPADAQVISASDRHFTVKAIGQTSALSWVVIKGQRCLNIAASDSPIEFTIARAPGKDALALIDSLKQGAPLDALIEGGQRNWPKTFTVQGKRSSEKSSYVMDTIPLPFDNDYNLWLRTTGVDFDQAGNAYITTYGGDVWKVSGIDTELKEVTWSVYASGLYETFGIKVVDGLVYVTTHNGIVRLHDLNADGEADYYEQFFTDPEISNHWHGYNFDLIRDSKGSFYYAKNGQFTDIKMEGGALKVAPDGRSYTVFATGFRTPNGMGLLPGDRITYGENQGQYVPAGKISFVEQGKWYGGAVNSSAKDRVPELPLIWLPQDVDNSCGAQLWIDDSRFGPYANQLMHTGCGNGTAMMVFIDEQAPTPQAAVQPFPFKFESGVMRLAINPTDGQVYLTGTRGWGVDVQKDGCLQRIRYCGAVEPLLVEVSTNKDSITLHFDSAINAAALNAAAFKVSAWNYKRTSAYGSKDYKPSAPEQIGRDTWAVSDVEVSQSGTAVSIKLPEMMPAHQVKVEYAIPFKSGAALKKTVHLTIHPLP